MKSCAIIKVFILMHCFAVFITNPAFCVPEEQKKQAEDLRQNLLEELSDIKLNKLLKDITIARKDYKWYAIMTGPENTPYSGGTFIIVIRFPISYPKEIPQVSFITKIYHPNVKNETGEICLKMFKNWSRRPKNIHLVLLNILLLFYKPKLKSCSEFVPEIASEYKENNTEYEKTAKLWTQWFAQKESEWRKIPNDTQIII